MANMLDLEVWHENSNDRRVSIDFSRENAYLKRYAKQLVLREGDNSLIMPYSILSKIESLEDWDNIKSLVEEYDNSFGSKDLPKFFIQGNFATFKITYFSIGMFVQELTRFIENEPFKSEIDELIEKFVDWSRNNITIADINRNEKDEKFEEYKEEFFSFRDNVKELLINKYNFRRKL